MDDLTRRGLVAATMCFSFLMPTGCQRESSRAEVLRLPSPDGRVDAVLFETNGGATTSFGYEVEVTQHGSQEFQTIAELYGATRNESAYGVNLRWATNSVLDVEFLRTKTPPITHNPLLLNGRAISAVLSSGVNDPSAPAGAMVSNLKRR